jgi:hypothetical protein
MAMTDEERRAKRRAYEQTPEVKAKRREYLSTPESRAKARVHQKTFNTTEKGKAKKARHKMSEPYKERVRANLPSYVTHLATRANDNRAWMLEESPEDVAQEYIDSHN